MSAAVPSPRAPTAPNPPRPVAFALIALAYVAAFGVALLVAHLARGLDPFVALALADLAATFVVFAWSRGLDNSSVYDPYWSVVPPIAASFLIASAHGEGVEVGARAWIVLGLVTIWGARLTWNWARGFPGLAHEDWRYVGFREKAGRAYWLLSLFGLHLFPTVWVLLGMLPLRAALSPAGAPLGWLDGLALFVTAGAIAIEAAADEQLRAFNRDKRPGEILARGLWAYSRHPNYFGEVSFWWGLFLFGLAADAAALWSIVGAVAMTALFVLGSVPMLDRRSIARRPEYAAHKRRVSALVPWFPRGPRG